MSESKRFLGLYQIPQAVIAQWMQTDPATRAPAEQKMRADWQTWMQTHGAMNVSSEAGGATKRETSEDNTENKNDEKHKTVVEGEAHEAVAKAFADHPHL